MIDVFVLYCVANIGGSGLSKSKYTFSIVNEIKSKYYMANESSYFLFNLTQITHTNQKMSANFMPHLIPTETV